METTLSRAQDPWHLLGWLTWRGDLVRHAVRWLLPNVPAPSRTSRRIRVLGTKLQERPRAGLNLLPSLSRVKWLVTCRKGQRSVAAVQRTPALPPHCTDKKSEISDSPRRYNLQLNLELHPGLLIHTQLPTKSRCFGSDTKPRGTFSQSFPVEEPLLGLGLPKVS